MSIDDIPPKLRQEGFIVYNGQKGTIKLSEKTCDELAPTFLEIEAQNKSESA